MPIAHLRNASSFNSHQARRFQTSAFLAHALFAIALADGLACNALAADAVAGVAAPTPKPEMMSIKLKGAGTFGGDIDMATQVFKPKGEPPFPVVVFSHGRVVDAVSRNKMRQTLGNSQLV